MWRPTSDDEDRVIEQLLIKQSLKGPTMILMPEYTVQAEINHRLERMPATSRRNARRIRTARRVAARTRLRGATT
ncbi:MAG: hypothetical protein M3Q98_03325 [Actinomycetota bacterium]|nr:hypothetical protein [Actinomycetota bacterium]